MFVIYTILILLAVSLIVGSLLSTPRYRGYVSDHLNGRIFFNPEKIQVKGFGSYFEIRHESVESRNEKAAV